MLKNSRLSWINESEAVEQGQPLTEKAGEPEGIWNSPAPSTQLVPWRISLSLKHRCRKGLNDYAQAV